jgi:YggT family protein
MVTMILGIASYLLMILAYFIVADAIISTLIAFNVINTYNNFVASIARGLAAITAPIYRPFRRILPNTGALDLAPFAALITITIIRGFVLPFLANPTLI